MEINYSKEFLKLYEEVNQKVKDGKKKASGSISDIRHSEILLFCLSFLSILAFFMAPIYNAKYIFLVVGILMIIISILYMIVNEIKIYGIKLKFKKEILKEFTAELNNNLEYKTDESISEVYYRKSGFNQTYKSIYSDGFVKGKNENRNFEMGNISVIKDITKSNQNITVEVFNGIFAYCAINGNIEEIDLMRVNSKNNIKEKLEIQNGKMYMYADNINEARTILDNNMIDKILNLKNELGIDVEFMVNKNETFYRFFTQNTVSTNLFASKNEMQALYFYYKIINFIIDFTKELESRI